MNSCETINLPPLDSRKNVISRKTLKLLLRIELTQNTLEIPEQNRNLFLLF